MQRRPVTRVRALEQATVPLLVNLALVTGLLILLVAVVIPR